MVGAVPAIGEDSWTIGAPVCCVNWYGHWTIVYSFFYAFTISIAAIAFYFEISSLLRAVLVLGYVWVGLLRYYSVNFNIIQCILSPPSSAPEVAFESCAVHQLLFGEINLFPIYESPWLHNSCCCKGKASSTWTLVLHSWNLSLRWPINVISFINFLTLCLF